MIKTPLGYILGFIYDFVGNYGWALVIFTILVKVILLPLTLKQQKSTIKMQQVQQLQLTQMVILSISIPTIVL